MGGHLLFGDSVIVLYNSAVFRSNMLEFARSLVLDDSSDEELTIPRRRPRFIRERIDHFDLDDLDFSRRFRLSKGSCWTVLELIENNLLFQSYDKNDAILPINQLLLTLRFYATGCTQMSAADFSGVSEPSANRIVHRVSAALASLYRQFVFLPRNAAEIANTQLGFYRIARFPCVLGAIDCTHVKIKSPGGEHSEYYRNRKGFFSLNVQAICNSDLELLDVVARWPGSSHDQTIFDHSRARAILESGEFGTSRLLADSAYANRQYIMTPVDRPTTPAEHLYNQAQIRSRNPIERAFGLWKRRFPVLAVGMNVRLLKCMPIIVATAVLYNILRRGGDPQPPDDPNVLLPMPWDELLGHGHIINDQPNVDPGRTNVRAPHRQALINDYFTTLLGRHA